MDQYDFDSLKARVTDLEERMKLLFRMMNVDYIEGDMQRAVNIKVRELLRQGNKIEAVKIFRETYNIGLADAKRSVDDIERTL